MKPITRACCIKCWKPLTWFDCEHCGKRPDYRGMGMTLAVVSAFLALGLAAQACFEDRPDTRRERWLRSELDVCRTRLAKHEPVWGPEIDAPGTWSRNPPEPMP